jgi:hypothetical protein
MYLNTSGNLLIGTTTDSGYKLDVNGTGRFKAPLTIDANSNSDWATGINNLGTTSANGLYVNIGASSTGKPFAVYKNFSQLFGVENSGAATFSSSVTATSFFESSDKTLKTLLVDNYQAKGIESITAKLYTKHGKEELGYFAQDVQGILPSAVTKGTNGLLNLSYREVHTAKIARLEKELEELKAKMN